MHGFAESDTTERLHFTTFCSLQTPDPRQFSWTFSPISHLEAFAQAGSSACHPLPRSITLSDTRPHPRPPQRPDPRAGLQAREQAPRPSGFSVRWGENGKGPGDQRLPEADPAAPPPPSDSLGRAGPRAAGEEAGSGHSGRDPGPSAGVP